MSKIERMEIFFMEAADEKKRVVTGISLDTEITCISLLPVLILVLGALFCVQN